MTTDQHPPSSLSRRVHGLRRRLPTYWDCARIIARIERLRELARHHRTYASDRDLLVPLETLLPAGTTAGQQHEVLRREIERLIPVVKLDLNKAGISTTIEFREGAGVTEWDLLENYFDVGTLENPRDWHAIRETFMRTLEYGIGLYSARKSRASWDLVNPLFWVGRALRVPVTVLEFAELENDEARTRLVRIYTWVVRVLMLTLLVALLGRFGFQLDGSLPMGHWRVSPVQTPQSTTDARSQTPK